MPTGDWQVSRMRPAVDRVLDRCVENERGCWVYQGATAGKGEHRYGRVTVGSRRDGTRRTAGTHQVVYEALIAPIPDGLELDHLVCRETRCCNPWHLDPVPHQINCERIVLTPSERQRRSEAMTLLNRERWAS